MKVISTNRLNRFWQKGVLPIKNALANKFDKSKILAQRKITEAGYVMDGKTASEYFDELNRKFPGSWHVDYTRITLNYDNGILRGYHLFDGNVLAATATIDHAASTPYNQTDELYVQRALGGTRNRIDVFARGQFVSGHVLNVNVIAIIQD